MNSASREARTVLVTDGEQRAALASVRSLGQAGFSVHVCSARGRSLAGASRYCAREHRVTDTLRDPQAFRHELQALASTLRADVVVPVSEAALLAVLPFRNEFNAVIPFGSAESFRDVCDKTRVLECARSQGIQVPAQLILPSAEAPRRLDRFPVVIKPSRSVVSTGNGLSKTSVLYANSLVELDTALASLPAEAYPVMLQERVEGPGFAISVLLWNGELRAAFAHRRIREKPPSGGVSVMREAVPLDHELLTRSVALLRSFGWQGVAMVEYKLQERTGVPYLMEINGRLWGSLQLAIDAGVDFPLLLVRAALGEPLAPVTEYRTDTRSRWEWGDVDHLLAMMRHSRVALALPAGAPGAWRTLADFVVDFGRRNKAEVFRLADPFPFVRETLGWIRGR